MAEIDKPQREVDVPGGRVRGSASAFPKPTPHPDGRGRA